MPELELNGSQESPPQRLMLLINKAFFFFSFLIRDEKIRFFKGNFQKHVFYFSLYVCLGRGVSQWELLPY